MAIQILRLLNTTKIAFFLQGAALGKPKSAKANSYYDHTHHYDADLIFP
jgi:hypothetical protein